MTKREWAMHLKCEKDETGAWESLLYHCQVRFASGRAKEHKAFAYCYYNGTMRVFQILNILNWRSFIGLCSTGKCVVDLKMFDRLWIQVD